MKLKNILFLCTGNSCRSQMAEGLARNFFRGRFNIYSAGIETHGLNPYAVEVMKEIGVDISLQESQLVDIYRDKEMDLVVTVCDNAKESCPIFPGAVKIVHHSFDDPPKLAERAITEEDVLDCYRTVRDEIKTFVEVKLDSLL